MRFVLDEFTVAGQLVPAPSLSDVVGTLLHLSVLFSTANLRVLGL